MDRVPLVAGQVFTLDGEEFVIDRVFTQDGLTCVDYKDVDWEHDPDHNIVTLAWVPDEDFPGWFSVNYMTKTSKLEDMVFGDSADTNLVTP